MGRPSMGEIIFDRAKARAALFPSAVRMPPPDRASLRRADSQEIFEEFEASRERSASTDKPPSMRLQRSCKTAVLPAPVMMPKPGNFSVCKQHRHEARDIMVE